MPTTRTTSALPVDALYMEVVHLVGRAQAGVRGADLITLMIYKQPQAALEQGWRVWRIMRNLLQTLHPVGPLNPMATAGRTGGPLEGHPYLAVMSLNELATAAYDDGQRHSDIYFKARAVAALGEITASVMSVTDECDVTEAEVAAAATADVLLGVSVLLRPCQAPLHTGN